MRWVCPGCGSQVSVALSQCPSCGSTEDKAVSSPTSPATPAAALAPPVVQAPRQRLLPVPRPEGSGTVERENPFWRGVKFGVGFMCAVAMILLLLALLLPWLREQGWQPWLDQASP